ncbi:unnamed protein product [Urochloa humidicola]
MSLKISQEHSRLHQTLHNGYSDNVMKSAKTETEPAEAIELANNCDNASAVCDPETIGSSSQAGEKTAIRNVRKKSST